MRRLPFLLALALLAGAAVAAPSITVPAGYQATATWAAVTEDIYGQPLVGSVTYKFYNVKNGVLGYQGSTSGLVFKWPVNVPQCVYVTSVIYVGGVAKESAPSSQFCLAIQ